MSCGVPFGELAGVVRVLHFHQAGQLAHEFDSAPERIVEFLARGDVIADGIPPFRGRALKCCFISGQVFEKIRRQFMSD